MRNKNDNHMVYGSWDIARDRHSFFVSLDRFLPFYLPSNPKNENFEKNKKSIWRHYHFTYVYHKWLSYDVWFLRYWLWQTELFVILDHLGPLTIQKIKILKNW